MRTVYFLEACFLWDGRGGVLVQGSKVARELELLVDVEVLLVAEENDAPLGYEEC